MRKKSGYDAGRDKKTGHNPGDCWYKLTPSLLLLLSSVVGNFQNGRIIQSFLG